VSKKFLSLFLITVTLLAPATTRASAAEELTDKDASEARSLAVGFMRRLRATDDFGPSVKEFFTKDFEQHLKQFIREAPAENSEEDFPIPCDRALLLSAESRELRRAYVASMNFWNQQELLHDAAWAYVEVEYAVAGKDTSKEYQEAWNRHEKLAKEAVPKEAYSIADSDPLLKVMFMLVRYDDSGAEESNEVDKAKLKAVSIHDAARLRSFLEKLERSVALLREGVARLRTDAKSLAAAHCIHENAPDDDALKVYYLDGETLEAAAFGIDAGTLLIHARIYPFEIVMTRRKGRLRIIAVYPDIDGD